MSPPEAPSAPATDRSEPAEPEPRDPPDDGGGFAFAVPAFKADEALTGLKRALRDVKGLSERANGRYELRGKAVIELMVEGDTIASRLARRPAASPDWDRRILRHAGDVRTWLQDASKRIARWNEDD